MTSHDIPLLRMLLPRLADPPRLARPPLPEMPAMITDLNVPILRGALCYGDDPELWWDIDRNGRARSGYARQVCQACPDRRACLQWALDEKEPDGLWGAMDPRQRADLMRAA